MRGTRQDEKGKVFLNQFHVVMAKHKQPPSGFFFTSIPSCHIFTHSWVWVVGLRFSISNVICGHLKMVTNSHQVATLDFPVQFSSLNGKFAETGEKSEG